MLRYNLGQIEPTYDNANDLFDNTLSLKALGNVVGAWNVTYGFDHAVGYFLQLFPLDEKAEEWLSETDEECFGVDSMFGGLTGAELAYFLQMFHGKAEHIDFTSLDLPI